MMKRLLIILTMCQTALAQPTSAGQDERLVWPPAPDQARVEYIGSIPCDKLSTSSGFFGKLKRFVGGRSAADELALPFDLVVTDSATYLVCQNLAGLVVVDRANNSFKVVTDKKKTLSYPISLCDDGHGNIYLTDSESAAVFRFADGKLEPFVTSGLNRPTGIAVLGDQRRLAVVDTGEHAIKLFDFDGKPAGVLTGDGLHFPTFAAATADGGLLINDALNFAVKRFSPDGALVSSLGREGDGPGSFARPKGMAVDSDGHVYVVDNLFDNVQIFDRDGRVLLAIGSAGSAPGQFWSPAGIDIAADTIFIADTYNNRIEMLRYLGEDE